MTKPFINKGLINYINEDVFIHHLNMPLYEKTVSSSDFLNNLKLIISNLDILMKMPHQEFWCHIIYDSSILRSLESFCNNATRPYELGLEDKIWDDFEDELHRKYYLLILRIISNNEKSEIFSNQNFGKLLYDNHIVDIPLLLDICALYGVENSNVISKMLNFIMTCQSKYLEDFKLYALQTMKFIEEKIISVFNVPKEKINFQLLKINKISEEESSDLLRWIIDLVYSWHVMLKIIKSQSEIFSMLFEIGFNKSIEKVFEKLVPFMQAKIDKFETNDPNRLKKLLSVSCYYLINVWRDIFQGKFIIKFHEDCDNISTENNFILIRDCIAAISSCQENPLFADAMYLLFPINDDFDMIFEAVKRDKDQYYLTFVNDSLEDIKREIFSRQTMFSSQNNRIQDMNNDLINTILSSNDDNMGVSLVQDIFPDLTTLEIEAYLKCYNCTTENMLEALLAGAIDVNFVKNTVNDDLNYRQSICQVTLSNHRNIYDGDDFDTGCIKADQLHIGKKHNTLESTIDPLLRKTILGIVVRQGEEEEIEDIAMNGNLIYEDEHDDVYGISHDGVVLDDRNVAEFTRETIPIEKPPKAYIVSNNAKENKKDNISKNTKLPLKNTTEIVLDKDEPILMEPSKLKFSKYDKRQIDKKKFHEGKSGKVDGSTSHRMGSHAKENQQKKDNHSKADRKKHEKS